MGQISKFVTNLGINNQTTHVDTPVIDGLEDLTVSSLIDHSKITWNETLVHDLFLPYFAVRILFMPIYPSDDQDKILWKFSKDGFSFFQLSLLTILLRSISHLHENGNWVLIWKLIIPHKMKVFLWRIARECLPTRDKLIPDGVDCQMQYRRINLSGAPKA